MNPEYPNNERAKLEAKLTALLLGELHADEVASLSEAMEADPELAALYERLKVTIELVREGAAQPKAEEQMPRKLSAEKREKLLASFKTVTPKEFAKPRRVMDSLAAVAAVVAIVGVLAALMLPAWSGAERKAMAGRSQTDQIASQDSAVWFQNLTKVPSTPATVTVTRGVQDESGPKAAQGPITAGVYVPPATEEEHMARRVAGVSPPAQQTATVVPADSTPGFSLGIAPAETPPVSGKRAPIVLPPNQESAEAAAAGQTKRDGSEFNARYAYTTDISGALRQLDSQQTNMVAMSRPSHSAKAGEMLLFGEENVGVAATNGIVPGAVAVRDAFNDQTAYQGISQLGTDDQNGKLALNYKNAIARSQTWAVDTGNKIGDATVTVDPDTHNLFISADEETTKAMKEIVQNLDKQSGNAQAGVSYYTNSYTRRSALADNGGADAGLGRFVLQNMDVASVTPTNAGIVVWGLTVSGVTNTAVVANNSWDYYDGPVGATHVGGVVQAQNQNSPLATRFNQGSGEWGFGGRNGAVGGFGGGSGFGGGGGFGGSDGKQVELAAAANSTVSNADRERLKTATVKVNPNSLVAAAPAAETPAPESGRGLRYVTGLDTGSEAQLAAKRFFESNGVNFDSAGKDVFYDDRQGTLTVRATDEDLDKVQAALNKLQNSKPDASADARFVQVNANDNHALGFDWYSGNIAQAGGTIVASGGSTPSVGEYEKTTDSIPTIHTPGSIPLTGQLPAPVALRTNSITTGTNWWNVPATVRGHYNDSANATAAASNRIAEYASAKERLDNAKKWRSALELKAEQMKTDVNLPRSEEVKVTDRATATSTEKSSLGQKIKGLFSSEVERVARVEIEPGRPDLGGIGTQGTLAANDDADFLQIEFEAMKSDDVLGRVIDKLNLDGGDKSKRQAAEAKLKESLDLRPVKNTKFIDIGASSEKPEEAARIANAVADAYREYRMEEFDKLNSGGIQTMQQQLAEQDKSISLLQSKVDAIAKEIALAQPTTGAPIVPAQQADTAPPKPTVPPPTPQPEILTRENAFSTFSLNVSDVSFKLAAASLEKGQMPEPASIRSEEFINAFDYRDPEAAPGVPIAFAAERARYPFAHNRELLRFSLKTAAAGRQAGQPLNIVLLLDNSGSMERADRVSIIREALRVLAGQLQAADTFSIVTFARTAQLRVDGIPGNQAAAASEEIAKLTPEGGTNLGDALDLAYETALHHYLANGDNRVVLLTDGAANLGDVDADVLKQKVEAHRKQGVALDCFGIGWEDYNDDLLEVLTRNGDGRYGFINKPEEANTTFVAQIAGALHVAAADVKVQVEFNPQRVTSYRQIGYAKHQLTKEQFRDNTVDAAEIAAQEAGNALYTIETNPEGSGSIATVRVRYKVPGTAEYREQAWDVPYTGTAVAMDQASPAMRLASTACGFSEWLATSPFASDVSPDDLLKYLSGVPQVYGADTRPAKLEWMIRQAKSISGK